MRECESQLLRALAVCCSVLVFITGAGISHTHKNTGKLTHLANEAHVYKDALTYKDTNNLIRHTLRMVNI